MKKKKNGITKLRAELKKHLGLIKHYQDMGVDESLLKVLHEIVAEVQCDINYITCEQLSSIRDVKEKKPVVKQKAVKIKKPTRS